MTREEAIDNLKADIKYWENTSVSTEHLYMAIKALEKEPCDDTISRKSIKQKLQEHHDFFVNAYGGFSNLPLNDKSRVDEITNCIAMVVNEPPVNPQPKMGHWIDDKCSVCGKGTEDLISSLEWYRNEEPNFCPFCGVNLVDSQESEDEE